MGKIDLDELKVESFVTSLNEKKVGRLRVVLTFVQMLVVVELLIVLTYQVVI